MCCFGITRTCAGATGLMSGKASAWALSATLVAGILPSTILQKMQSAMVPLESFLRVEQQSNRAFVDDAQLHGGAEHALLDVDAAAAAESAEAVVERLGRFRRRRVDEGRPAPLARVAVQSELGDGEHRALHLD